YLFITANLVQFCKGFGAAVTETMCFVNKHIRVFVRSSCNNLVQLTKGFHIAASNVKFLQNTSPVINQYRWTYNQLVSVSIETIGKHGANISFTKTYNV